MTRKPTFWITLTTLGIAGSVLALRLFPVAFPILSVNIEMDRQEALDDARALAEHFLWGPGDFRQAASFTNVDPTFQTYMELEGGGLESLNRLVEDGVLSLYAWRVRHFAPGAVEEAEIQFTPGGAPYGFRLRLSEDAPGENLDSGEARNLAVAEASAEWGMDPDLFSLLETSQEEHPGGRLDHTFVFERSDLKLGEARIRLRLRVGGNRLTEVAPLLHVPEAFTRRYQDTRNVNESISLAGTVIFLLLFLVLGGGYGAMHLLKARQLEWKAPLAWGGIVAGLLALGSVNSLPLAWMSYDTAVPTQVFVASVVLTAVITFVAGAGLLALVFMVAEGLMRLGFPEEIRLWKTWAPGVANSVSVLGRTGAPYLIVGIELGYVVTFYLVMSRSAGWWSPAGALVEPDLLATHMPWLTAVGTSLFAAFSEESIFRAIPIGAAALLGRRYGRPGLWIWGAVVLQAVVFGASHANYPQQPAYARVVEIVPTYLAWGAITVSFGLVPAIIGHFAYDLVFFSLPLFAADTAGIWVDRTVVIMAGVLPLAIVLVSRWRLGSADRAPESALNRAWSSSQGHSVVPHPKADAGEGGEGGTPVGEPRMEPEGKPSEPAGPSSGAKAALVLAAFVGTTLWARGIDPDPPPSLALTRSQAEDRAMAALDDRGVDLGSGWVPLFSVSASRGAPHQFVWETGTESDYRSLAGGFLNAPGWEVRFVNFDSAPEERAESYRVGFSPDGNQTSITHVLPEGRPGEALEEGEARSLALEALERLLKLTPDEVREVSAEKTSRPNRVDWTFTFSAIRGYPLQTGEGRAEVRIAGSEIVEANRSVHVPEEWERAWRGDQSRRGLARVPLAGLLFLMAAAGMVVAIVKWARGSLATAPLRILTGVAGGTLIVATANSWPNTLGSFTTELSLGNQLAVTLLGVGLAAVAVAAGVGLLGALAHTWLLDRLPTARGEVWVGLSLGTLFVGLGTLFSGFIPPRLPGWPDYSGAVAFLSWLSPALGDLTSFLVVTALGLLTLASLERLKGTRWFWMGILLALLVGFNLASNPPGQSWWIWVIQSCVMTGGVTVLWVLCRRWGWSIVPGVLAAPVLLNGLGTAMAQPYPGAALGSLLGLAAVAAVAHGWTRALRYR